MQSISIIHNIAILVSCHDIIGINPTRNLACADATIPASQEFLRAQAISQLAEGRVRTALTTFILLASISGAAADMSVSFVWGPTKKCFDPKSPPMKITGVPAGTTNLDIHMTDRDSDYNHGGGKIAYRGQISLPYGAFKYQGPCPPTGSHTYSFTVKAVDSKGKTLATAKASRKFPE